MPASASAGVSNGRASCALVCRREVGVTVSEAPHAIVTAEDMCDANRHPPRRAAIDTHVATLDTDGAREASALVIATCSGFIVPAPKRPPTQRNVVASESNPCSIGPHAP